MAVTFNNLPLSLKAINKLNSATSRLTSTFEKLSSGQRINRAADDAAALAIADQLRADARITTIAIRNANDGISLTTIADSALSEIGNMLARMGELAEQSANGVYTNTQRSALASEFNALGSEIERIAVNAEFNTLKLLSGGSNVTLQVGIEGDSNSQIVLQGVQGTLQSLSLANTGSSALKYSIIGTTTAYSQAAATNALDAINTAIDTLTSSRGVLGSAESRLNSAINNLSMARENFVAAESRIRDIDVAEETANLTRFAILQQSATAMAAQANLQPQLVLRLLS
jgi:flagellin